VTLASVVSCRRRVIDAAYLELRGNKVYQTPLKDLLSHTRSDEHLPTDPTECPCLPAGGCKPGDRSGHDRTARCRLPA